MKENKKDLKQLVFEDKIRMVLNKVYSLDPEKEREYAWTFYKLVEDFINATSKVLNFGDKVPSYPFEIKNIYLEKYNAKQIIATGETIINKFEVIPFIEEQKVEMYKSKIKYLKILKERCNILYQELQVEDYEQDMKMFYSPIIESIRTVVFQYLNFLIIQSAFLDEYIKKERETAIVSGYYKMEEKENYFKIYLPDFYSRIPELIEKDIISDEGEIYNWQKSNISFMYTFSNYGFSQWSELFRYFKLKGNPITAKIDKSLQSALSQHRSRGERPPKDWEIIKIILSKS